MRWWELAVPALIIVVGLAAPEKPLGNANYALAGVLISAFAAWFTLVLMRRSRLLEFLKALGSEHLP